MHGFPLPLTTRPSAATMPVASGINRQAISAFQGSEHPSTVEEVMAQRLQQVHQAIAHRVSEAVQTTMAQNTQASVSQAQASIPQVRFQAKNIVTLCPCLPLNKKWYPFLITRRACSLQTEECLHYVQTVQATFLCRQ